MKKVIALGAALLMLLLASGCGKQAETDTAQASVVVGFSQLGAESSWRIANTESMENAAKEAGFGLMMENANQKQEKQIDAIRSFIAYQVDVIVFSPIVENGWDNVLNEAKKAGIPVILMDRMIETTDKSLYTAYVGADFYAEGRRAGEYLIRKADATGAAHLNIAEISGTLDSTPMRDRQRGVMDAISGDSRFTVIDSICGDFLRSKGKECMESLLRKYPDQIDVLYSHNDAMTLGAIEVMEEQGIEPGKDIVIISVDGEQAAIDLLKEGKINCVVECSPMLGDAVMDLAEKIVSGQEYPRITHPEETFFTEYDDLSDLAPRGY